MKPTNIWLRSLFAIAVCALPQAARAAGALTGRVSGYVYDPTGAALAEVPLTISSAEALPNPQSRVTGEDGRFEFDNLPPGEDYVIEVNVPGFTPIKQTGIKVRVGATTPADVSLTVLTETQAVATFQIIEKVNPVLNPDSAQSGGTISAEQIYKVPIFGQAEQMAQQVAGAGPSDGSGRLSTRGGIRRFTKFFVDGLDTTDITDSGITSPINFNAAESFEVMSGGMDAQYNSLGMITNVVTKNGSNRWTYDLALILQPDWMAGKNKFPVTQQQAFNTYWDNPDLVAPNISFFGPSANLGGPIIKDKLWFYASYQQNFSGRENPIAVDGVAINRPRDTTTSLGRLKLTYQPTAKDRVTAAFSLDRNVINNNLSDSGVAQDSENKIHRGGEWFVVNWDHNFTDNVLFQLATGLTYKAADTDPIFEDFNTPSHFDTGSSTTRFNSGSISAALQGNFMHESKYKITFDPTISWKAKWNGTHQLKAGFQYSFMYDVQITGVSGNQRFTDRGFIRDDSINAGNPVLTHGKGCDPTDSSTFSLCNTVRTYYNQNLQAAPLTSRAWARTYGFFMQDRWTVNRRLTLIGGLRMDIGRLQGESGLVTTPLVGLGPRFSATFDLFGDRKTLLKAHAGRSIDVGNAFVAQHGNASLFSVQSSFDTTANAFRPCPLNPADNTFGTNCQYAGGASGRSFAAGQAPPFVHELAAGIAHEIVPETVMGLDFSYRHYGNMWADEEINRIWDLTGTRIIGSVDPSRPNQSVILTQARSDAYRKYGGMDVWIQGNPGRWDLLASYTLAYNWGRVDDYFDGYLNNARMTPFYEGWTGDDRRHSIKGSISYRTTFGLDIGSRIRYSTGTALWEGFSVSGDNTFVRRSPRGTGFPIDTNTFVPNFNDPNSWTEIRDPSVLLLDLQARYNVAPLFGLKQQKAEVILLVVNALNDSSTSGYSTTYSTTRNRFALSSFHNSPLQAEVFLRFRN